MYTYIYIYLSLYIYIYIYIYIYTYCRWLRRTSAAMCTHLKFSFFDESLMDTRCLWVTGMDLLMVAMLGEGEGEGEGGGRGRV